MKSWLLALAIAGTSLASNAAPPLGDTQGIVTSVRVVFALGTAPKSFEVWFSQVQNNRWNCLGSGQKIVIYDNGYGVTPESFKQMFVLATLAQASGKPLGLDSSAVNPCTNVNTAWVVS